MFALVLDFDGPLFDARSAAKNALSRTLNEFDSEIGRPVVTFETLPLLASWQMISLVYSPLEITQEQLQIIHHYYKSELTILESAIPLHADVARALKRAADQGTPLAIYSSRRIAELTALLTRLGIIRAFKIIVGSDHEEDRKPSASGLLKIANYLHTHPQRLVFVGDSDSDFLSAQAAKTKYLHAGWTGEPAHLGFQDASKILTQHTELEELLDSLTSTPSISSQSLPEGLLAAIDARSCAFCAGAGVSIPSGFGSWIGHYAPLIKKLKALSISRRQDVTKTMQHLAVDDVTKKALFDEFRTSFASGRNRPNEYHYSMLRSTVSHIWTSNYDNLFEDANTECGFGAQIAPTDDRLLEHFSAPKLVVKMNGDTQSARYDDNLHWNVVLTEEQFDTVELTRPEIWRLFEDDYRGKCIVFVGLSFNDPALRRITTLARTRVRRTKYNHFFIAKRPDDPLLFKEATLLAKNLARLHIQTLFFAEHADIAQFVGQLSVRSLKPRIGISGSAVVFNSDGAYDSTAKLPGGDASIGELDGFCERLGRCLGNAGYSVLSCGAPFVGIPAVRAAFETHPYGTKFILRQGVDRKIPRVAPAFVVDSPNYSAMRETFASHINFLVAIGGVPGPNSGVLEEINLALQLRLPVLIIRQFGGVCANGYEQIVSRFLQVFGDSNLTKLLTEVNANVSRMDLTELNHYLHNQLSADLSRILVAWVGSNARASASNLLDLATLAG